jgi:hypothetical protein
VADQASWRRTSKAGALGALLSSVIGFAWRSFSIALFKSKEC